MKKGIDVSQFNDLIDWKKVKESGVTHVWIRASLGVNFTDTRFKQNALGAVAEGLQVGLYHFASLNDQNVLQDAATEARFFASKLNSVNWNFNPVLDLESNEAGLEPQQVETWVNVFMETLEREIKNLVPIAIKRPILYSYTPFLDSFLPKGLPYPLWLAQYNDKPAPLMPKGWKELFAWQYSAKGRVDGIKTDVDMNRIYNSPLNS